MTTPLASSQRSETPDRSFAVLACAELVVSAVTRWRVGVASRYLYTYAQAVIVLLKNHGEHLVRDSPQSARGIDRETALFGSDSAFWLLPSDYATAGEDFIRGLEASRLRITLQAENNVDLEATDGGGVSLSGRGAGGIFPGEGVGLEPAPLSLGLAHGLFALMKVSGFALRPRKPAPMLRAGWRSSEGGPTELVWVRGADHLYELLQLYS